MDIYAEITNRIISEIEKDGILAWQKPWMASGAAMTSASSSALLARQTKQ